MRSCLNAIFPRSLRRYQWNMQFSFKISKPNKTTYTGINLRNITVLFERNEIIGLNVYKLK